MSRERAGREVCIQRFRRLVDEILADFRREDLLLAHVAHKLINLAEILGWQRRVERD